MKKILLISLLTIITTGCSEFALLMSGSSIAISQNAYVKAYNGYTNVKELYEHSKFGEE